MRLLRADLPAASSFLLSLRRSPWQRVAAWPDAPPALGREVAIFVHYDPAGAVAPRVLFTLDRLREAGLDVLFVSNAGGLAPEAWAALRDRCAGVLVRRNVGYDFGAWREGLAYWRDPLAGVARLLLMNDSVLGPFAPLRPLLDTADFARADFWGAVDSEQRAPHVQSWFLLVGRSALDHPAWVAFWASVRPVRSRAWVVARYEIGLSRALRAGGLQVAALFPYPALVARALAQAEGSDARQKQAAHVRRLLAGGLVLNAMADLWRTALEAGCPFIKRELLERNPARVKDAAEASDEAVRRSAAFRGQADARPESRPGSTARPEPPP